jgi:hypothetical protein
MVAGLRDGGSCLRDCAIHVERVERAAPRRRRVAALMLAACTLACVGIAALANPGPSGLVFTHIHAGEGGFCSALPVSTCEDLVQVSDATGILCFDMILPWWWDDFEWLYGAVTNLEFTVQWPAEWQFVQASACGSGAVGVIHRGNGATFWIENLEGAPVNGQLLGLGRLVLNVTSEGSTSCPDWPYPEGIAWVGGRISECGNCMEAICTDWEPIRPALPSPVLELAAGDSGMASGQFHVDCEGMEGGGSPTAFAFDTTEPWITLQAVSVGSSYHPEYDVTVTANAQALSPGVHEAWVEVQVPYCYECERIVFTVPETDPPATIPETWGSLKSKFR